MTAVARLAARPYPDETFPSSRTLQSRSALPLLRALWHAAIVFRPALTRALTFLAMTARHFIDAFAGFGAATAGVLSITTVVIPSAPHRAIRSIVIAPPRFGI